VGNVISNEPGYYEDGSFGIRIESEYFLVSFHFVSLLIKTDIIMVREVKTQHNFGDKPYLGFEHVTMTPMCRKLIDPALLSSEEKEWLNDYHSEVLEKTKSYFRDNELTMAWLKRETAPYS
jgi:Xaa-Pro aminopeptidase